MVHRHLLLHLLAVGCLAGCNRDGLTESAQSGELSGVIDRREDRESVTVESLKADSSMRIDSWSTDRQTFLFAPPDYRGAWSSSFDSDLIQFVILDPSGAEEIPVLADGVLVHSQDGAVFVLDGVDVDPEGRTAIFELDDPNLAMAMPLGVTVEMLIADRVYRGTIKPRNQPSHRP